MGAIGKHELLDLQAAALEGMPTGAALVDRTGAVVFTNAAWRALGGAAGGAHPRQALPELVTEADAGALGAAVEAMLAGSKVPYRAQLQLRGAIPQTWIEARLTPLGEAGVLLLLEDVSERREEREAAVGAASLRESEATLRAILQAIPDVVFRVRRDGTVVEHSEELTEATRTPRGLLATIAEQSAMYAERALETGTPKGGMCRLTLEGQSRDYDTRLVPYGPDEALVIARDITDQTRTEEELQLFLGITLTTGEAADLRAALTVVLRLVCESTGWVLGAAWVPEEHGALHCDAVWLAHDTPQLRAFRDRSGAHTAAIGEGMAGRVWVESRAAWVRDFGGLADDRAHAAAAAGLKTAFAVPVLAGTEIVAVLEFYAFEARDEDPRLLTMVSAVAEQLGALMKRKRVEESVRLLQSALEQLSEPIIITTANPAEGSPRIVFVSPAFSRMTGYTAEDALGHGLDILAGPNTDPGAASQMRSDLLAGRVVELESIIYRKDGSELPVEWRVAPARAAEGAVSHFIAIQRDITQRKQIEAARLQLQHALEMAAQQWRLTFDAIESAIFLLDRDVRVLRLNRAAKALASSDYKEQLGRKLETLGEGEPWREGGAVARATLESGAPASSQARDELRKKTWDFSATLIDDASGGEKMILIVRDITRLVELQESLRRSETMSAMGSLVAGVAHEVRNPLQAITATLDAFEARFRAAEPPPHIAVLRGEVTRLTVLMRDLLDYGKPAVSRLHAGDLGETIAQAVAVCTSAAAEGKVTIESRVAPGLPAVFLDRQRLLQVMTNVLENAIQHSKQGGRVAVSAREVVEDGGRWVECEVADQGTGFAEADLGRVFEPFFTRRKGGTGLGLSIVHRIVDEHRGRVWASNGRGGGGIVTVRLPVPAARAYDSRLGR